tara:strand:- start:296 stop:1165 length:870 start_codon:yes stop_codon:yes gene_type:complete
MADTFVADVEAGLNTMVASARRRTQFPTNVMQRVVDNQRLEEGTGTAWREFLTENLTAQNYGESDVIDNPQSISGSILSVTPQLVAIQTFIGRRVQARLSPKAFDTFGALAQEGIERKKNTDGHAVFATATTTLGTTGTTLSYTNVDSAIQRIKSDATEPGQDPIAVVLHGYHLHDIRNEIIAGVGTYNIPEGMTAEVFRAGFRGMLNGGNVFHDGLIAVDSTPDARGAVFAKRGILLVQGLSPWKESREEPQKGYGGMNVWLKDEYLYAERSPGNWLFGILGDATAPT